MDTGFAPIGLDEPYRIVVENNPVNWIDPFGLKPPGDNSSLLAEIYNLSTINLASNYIKTHELGSLQDFLKNLNTYASISAAATALSGLEPAAVVLGGVALGAKGLEIGLYPNKPYVDVAAESLKMTVPAPYSILTDEVIDKTANKAKEHMNQNKCK